MGMFTEARRKSLEREPCHLSRPSSCWSQMIETPGGAPQEMMKWLYKTWSAQAGLELMILLPLLSSANPTCVRHQK